MCRGGWCWRLLQRQWLRDHGDSQQLQRWVYICSSLAYFNGPLAFILCTGVCKKKLISCEFISCDFMLRMMLQMWLTLQDISKEGKGRIERKSWFYKCSASIDPMYYIQCCVTIVIMVVPTYFIFLLIPNQKNFPSYYGTGDIQGYPKQSHNRMSSTYYNMDC